MFEIQNQKMMQAIRYLNEHQLDVWVIYTSEGSDPCIPLVTGVGTVGPGVFLINASGERVAMCSPIDAQDIEESLLFDRVIRSTDLASDLGNYIRQVAPSTIALNYSLEEHLADGLTVGRYRWLMKALEGSFSGTYHSAEQLLNTLRSIKAPAEIDAIERAIEVTLAIYDEVYNELRPGMTEYQAGQLFVQAMKRHQVVNGIDRTLSMPIVMKENIAHRAPGEAVIEPGDLVIFDFSVDVDGYVSDIARTVYFLKEDEIDAPQVIQQAFQAVHTAISKAAEQMKPGVQGYEVDAAARDYYVAQGYPEISHATGHQIGQAVHDGGGILGPRWQRYGQAPYEELAPGMVFTIEPTLFMDDGIHFIVEENVVITKEGIRYLSQRQDELILIPHTKVGVSS